MLPLITPELSAIAEEDRGFYVPHQDGGFQLHPDLHEQHGQYAAAARQRDAELRRLQDELAAKNEFLRRWLIERDIGRAVAKRFPHALPHQLARKCADAKRDLEWPQDFRLLEEQDHEPRVVTA